MEHEGTLEDSSGDADPGSPRIEDASWGRIEVEGRKEPFKDAKLWPGGARAWDWSETGTRHEPGVQPADVRELVEQGARRVILSRGRMGRLRIREDTLAFLEEEGVKVEVLRTGDAIRRYNELADREPVGALIHSTC